MLGADDGDRTRVTGLGNQCSTIELHPHFKIVGLPTEIIIHLKGKYSK